MTTVLTRSVARAMLAPILVVAVAVLVKGYVDVGDGFAGGVIAALGILLQYLAFGRAGVEAALPVRRAPQLALVGLLVALAVAFVPLLAGEPLLTHFPAAGAKPVHVGAIELITAVAFDVGVFLLVTGVCVAIIHHIAAARAEHGPEAGA